MNVTNRLGAAVAGVQGARRTIPPPSKTLARVATCALLVLLVFVAAGTAGLALYGSTHVGRIYQGVRVAGLDLSGLTPVAARAELEAYFAGYAAAPLTLVAGDQTFQITPTEAGARLDGAATIDAALAWGRNGSFWSRSQAWMRGMLHGVSIPPAIVLDPTATRGTIAALAPDVVRPPVDATLNLSGGNAEIVPDVTGVRLDYAATASALMARIAAFGSDPVTLVTEPDPPAVTAASLAPNLPEAQAAVDAPLVLAAGDAVWHVPAADLRPLIGVDPATAGVRIDRRPLTALVESLATEVNRDAVDASIGVDSDGRLTVVPSATARKVDVEASVAAIADGLVAGKDEISLVVQETPPQISDEMAAAAVKRGEDLMDPGITLTWSGGEGFLDRADLLQALTIRTRPGSDDPFVFGLDPDYVWNSLSRYSNQFDIPVQDARWRIINGKIELSEGDLVMTFNKTIDLLRQVGEMLQSVNPEHPLRGRLRQAESLLKRDIVEHSLVLGFAPIELPEIARAELDAAVAIDAIAQLGVDPIGAAGRTEMCGHLDFNFSGVDAGSPHAQHVALQAIQPGSTPLVDAGRGIAHQQVHVSGRAEVVFYRPQPEVASDSPAEAARPTSSNAPPSAGVGRGLGWRGVERRARGPQTRR